MNKPPKTIKPQTLSYRGRQVIPVLTSDDFDTLNDLTGVVITSKLIADPDDKVYMTLEAWNKYESLVSKPAED